MSPSSSATAIRNGLSMMVLKGREGSGGVFRACPLPARARSDNQLLVVVNPPDRPRVGPPAGGPKPPRQEAFQQPTHSREKLPPRAAWLAAQGGCVRQGW